MVNSLKYLLFKIVLAVLILHTITPHPHSCKPADENHLVFHQQANSFISLIIITFHERNNERLADLVFPQFDTNRKRINKTKSPRLAFIKLKPSILKRAVSEKIAKKHLSTLSRLFFIKQHGLRAPPVFA